MSYRAPIFDLCLTVKNAGSLIHQLDQRHLGGVTPTIPQLENPGVSSRAFRKTGPNFVEKLAKNIAVRDRPTREPTRMQIPTSAKRDQPLGERA
jgi:hypothetical protein